MTSWTYPDTKSGQSVTIDEGSPMGLLLLLTYASAQSVASMWSYPDSKSATAWSYPDNKN